MKAVAVVRKKIWKFPMNYSDYSDFKVAEGLYTNKPEYIRVEMFVLAFAFTACVIFDHLIFFICSHKSEKFKTKFLHAQSEHAPG